MKRILLLITMFFAPLLAFAQSKAAAVEPATPKADTLTIVLFLILFFGSMIGYGIYLYLGARNGPKEE